ncbi:MAG: hypothetical protein HY308_17695 [Gammaproteobacteria bacterium]|nr:hypothetical protein [Gammaproteobacteria bacterium]
MNNKKITAAYDPIKNERKTKKEERNQVEGAERLSDSCRASVFRIVFTGDFTDIRHTAKDPSNVAKEIDSQYSVVRATGKHSGIETGDREIHSS